MVATNDPKADKTWLAIERVYISEEQKDVPALLKGADMARDFYTHYPTHPDAEQAHYLEYTLLAKAWFFGATNVTSRLMLLESERVKDTHLGEDERFELRRGPVQRLAAGPFDEFEKSARALQKDFPTRRTAYFLLEQVMFRSDAGTALALAKEIIAAPAPGDIKKEAQRLLNQLAKIGKPVTMKFTALDGREVDVAKMRGRVVLIDFWSTTCAPCVAGALKIKVTYEKFHPQGLEVIGVSLDENAGKLRKFVKAKEIPWPQYFAANFKQDKFYREIGEPGIPVLLLVDKQGNLRQVNWREPGDLEGRIVGLLEEP